METITCDVLVVGAGAAGSVAALKAAKEGLNTVLIEKTEKIGGHCQTKIDVTEGTGVQDIFNELKLPALAKTNVSKWFSPKKSFEFSSKVSDFFIKRGPEKDSFENIVVDNAVKKGCEVYNGVETVKNGKNAVTIRKGKKETEVKFKDLIAADGWKTGFLRKMQIKETNEITITGYGKITNRSNMPKDVTHVFLDNSIMPGGYFYTAKTRNLESACIVFSKPMQKTEMKGAFERLIKENHKLREIFEGATTVSEFTGASVASDINERVKENIFLAGDAGRTLDPLFGYGVRQAIYSGYYAATAITNHDTKEAKRKYEEKMRTLVSEFSYARKGRKIFEKLDNCELDLIFDFAIQAEKTESIDNLIDEPFSLVKQAIKYSIKKPKFGKLALNAARELIF